MIAGIMNTSLDVFITVTILTKIGLTTGIFAIVMTLIVVLAIMSYPCYTDGFTAIAAGVPSKGLKHGLLLAKCLCKLRLLAQLRSRVEGGD